MPKNSLKRDEFLVKVTKMKNELYNGSYSARNAEWHEGAHHTLNKVMDMLDEYRY